MLDDSTGLQLAGLASAVNQGYSPPSPGKVADPSNAGTERNEPLRRDIDRNRSSG